MRGCARMGSRHPAAARPPARRGRRGRPLHVPGCAGCGAVPLRRDQADEAIGQYAAEARRGAELIGVRPDDVPTSASSLRAHMNEWLSGGQLEVTDTARQVAGAMLRPPLSWVGGPLARLHALSAIGWLP